MRATPDPPAPPARYETILRLASGGMATVWIGTVRGALGFRQLVAIKKPHPHLLSDPNFRGELLAEARLASMIRHANVVDVRDVEIDGDSISLVMDYIEGASLGDLLVAASKEKTAAGANRIPARAAVRIIRDACAGLHAAHELVDERDRPVGLVHRDVSPQNVLVGTDGISRVTDFGVAKFARKNMQSTSEGSLKGKLAYMAPEYVRGETIDRRFDVFACGVVLWEALTGKRCFRGDNEAETLRRLLDHVPEPVSTMARSPELEPLDSIVACALAKDRDERFQNAAAMGAALEAAASATNLMGSHTEVAALLKELAGRAIEERRSLVRAKLANEPSVASLMGHPTIDVPALAAGAGGGGDAEAKITAAAPTPIGVASLEAPPTATAATLGVEVPPTRIVPQHREAPLGPTLPIGGGGVVAPAPAPAPSTEKAATPKMGGAGGAPGNATVGAASAIPSTQPMTPPMLKDNNNNNNNNNAAAAATLAAFPNGSPRTLASAPPMGGPAAGPAGPAGGTHTKPSPQASPPQQPPQQSPRTLASAPPIGAPLPPAATTEPGFGGAPHHDHHAHAALPHQPELRIGTLRSEDPSDPQHNNIYNAATGGGDQTQTQAQPQMHAAAMHANAHVQQHVSSELASAFPVSAPPRRSLLPFIITAVVIVGAVVGLIVFASKHAGSNDGSATSTSSSASSASATAATTATTTTAPTTATTTQPIASSSATAATIPTPTPKATTTTGQQRPPRGHSNPTPTPSTAPAPLPSPSPAPTPTSTIKKPPDNPYNN